MAPLIAAQMAGEAGKKGLGFVGQAMSHEVASFTLLPISKSGLKRCPDGIHFSLPAWVVGVPLILLWMVRFAPLIAKLAWGDKLSEDMARAIEEASKQAARIATAPDTGWLGTGGPVEVTIEEQASLVVMYDYAGVLQPGLSYTVIEKYRSNVNTAIDSGDIGEPKGWYRIGPGQGKGRGK